MKHQRLPLIICCGLVLIMTAAVVVIGRTRLIMGQELGYCFLSYVVIYPLITIFCSIYLSRGNAGCRWPFSVLAGAAGVILSFRFLKATALLLGVVGMFLSLIIFALVKKSAS